MVPLANLGRPGVTCDPKGRDDQDLAHQKGIEQEVGEGTQGDDRLAQTAGQQDRRLGGAGL